MTEKNIKTVEDAKKMAESLNGENDVKDTSNKKMAKKNEPIDIFGELSKIDVSEYLDDKNGFSYLNWAAAWTLVKRFDPQAQREFVQFDELYADSNGIPHLTGRKVDFFKDLVTNTAMVECVVTIKGEKFVQSLPVMNFNNKAVINPTYIDINNAQQRCFVKTLAISGLGISVFAKDKVQPKASEKEIAKLEAEIAKLKVLNTDAEPNKLDEFVNWLLSELQLQDLNELTETQYNSAIQIVKDTQYKNDIN